MPEITIVEGEDAAKADYTLSYSQEWSDASKQGLPVAKTDTTEVYFYANSVRSSSSAWLTLNDSNGATTGIEWLDTVNGKIRIHFPSTSMGHAGDGQYYELRIKFIDGTELSVEEGTLNVIPSITGHV